MEKRKFGRTGLDVSLLGFGCGAVGGLMIKGAAADQERAVARAVELGINYFDTAQMYGNGESERNLGRVGRRHGLQDVDRVKTPAQQIALPELHHELWRPQG